MSADLVRFVEARIAEDEARAKAASPGPWKVDSEDYAEVIYAGDGYNSVVSGGRWGGEASCFDKTEDALHIARHDPARVLRQCEAFRRIVEDFKHLSDPSRGVLRVHAEWACRTLAAIWSDHPEFRKEWAA